MKTKMNRVVISGATGFLGQHLTQTFIENHYEVHILVRDSHKAKQLFKNNSVNIIKSSLLDQNSLKKIPTGAAVFHCAALTGSCLATKHSYDNANIEGSRNFLLAAIEREASCFTFISSISAVGAEGSLENPITELTTPNPRTYYGKSKLAAENIIFDLAPKELPITIVRPPLIYGINQKKTSGSGMLFKLCDQKYIPFIGALTNVMPLISVKNLVRGLIEISHHNDGKEIFNLADAQHYTVMDLATQFNKFNKSESRFYKIPYSLVSLLANIADGFSWTLKRDLGFCSELIKGLGKNGYFMNIEKAIKFGYKPDKN